MHHFLVPGLHGFGYNFVNSTHGVSMIFVIASKEVGLISIEAFVQGCV